ncbi:MAG: hypothetical protein HY319_11160 [Armatimonadetes bacterium]|nr:hypothetical protein [Armatimonadota bacterium]
MHFFWRRTVEEMLRFLDDPTRTLIGPVDPARVLHGARRGLVAGMLLGAVLGCATVLVLLCFISANVDPLLHAGGLISGVAGGGTFGGIIGLFLGILVDLLSVPDYSRFFASTVPRGGLLQLEVDQGRVSQALRGLRPSVVLWGGEFLEEDDSWCYASGYGETGSTRTPRPRSFTPRNFPERLRAS